jgi:Ca2+-binding RTX toxin-like protein
LRLPNPDGSWTDLVLQLDGTEINSYEDMAAIRVTAIRHVAGDQQTVLASIAGLNLGVDIAFAAIDAELAGLFTTLNLTAGNDRLVAYAASDIPLFAGAGDDTYVGITNAEAFAVTHEAFAGSTVDFGFAWGPVSVDLRRGSAEGEGRDRLTGVDNVAGSENNDAISGNAHANALSGGDGNDRIWGHAGNDRLDGLWGRDTLYGGTGNDVLLGGSGADLLRGGKGLDTLRGGADGDTLYGEAGNDRLYGEAGGDLLGGGGGRDTLSGGAGYDTLKGGDGDDRLYGDADNDRLEGGWGRDTLLGGTGHDTLYGDGGDDLLSGGDGDDLIYGGAGNDTLVGGKGWNMFDGSDGVDTVSYQSLDQRYLVVSLETQSARAGLEYEDQLYGIENVIGSRWGDDIAGDAGANAIDGLSGNDSLGGGAGNDTLIGGAGRDTLAGGDGDDRLVLSGDVAWGGGGYDVFQLRPLAESNGVASRIYDFTPGEDRFLLDAALFDPDAVAGGTLAADVFAIGASAAAPGQHLLYDPETGALAYDADGAGGADAITLAVLGRNLTLSADDFSVS